MKQTLKLAVEATQSDGQKPICKVSGDIDCRGSLIAMTLAELMKILFPQSPLDLALYVAELLRQDNSNSITIDLNAINAILNNPNE
jgi:hypothetical protein